MKKIILFLYIFFSLNNYAQDGIYFDKNGKSTSKDEAYYFRKQINNTEYKSHYVNGGALYFEGNIISPSNIDENLNKYTGKCTWFYKSGNKKLIKQFDDMGLESGITYYYYESGKIWKEYDFQEGKIKNSRYIEYSEDGQQSHIFEEEFENNLNDWDLYVSEKSISKINNHKFELTSLTKEGTTRYISIGGVSEDITLEIVINTEQLSDGQKAGLIFGFKDWSNYNFFLISGSSMYIGSVYEGVSLIKAEGMFASSIVKKGKNTLKLITTDDKIVYSINGEPQFTNERVRNIGTNIGFAITGKSSITIDKLVYKDINYKSSNVSVSKSDYDVKATGSGIIISNSGYIITNHHVIENANKIQVEITTNNLSKQYSAILVQKDIDNDLAILKINDESFKQLDVIKYSFKEAGGVEVGAPVFTLGFPLALSGMGKEAKYTDGKVSSKTGYNGSVNSFQTSIPVQPGNSGGPVFNTKGELIGVINAKIANADNVSYAIKLNYIKNLLELVGDISLPNDQSIIGLSNEEKIKVLSNYSVLIKIK